jgi:hypothetical protein
MVNNWLIRARQRERDHGKIEALPADRERAHDRAEAYLDELDADPETKRALAVALGEGGGRQLQPDTLRCCWRGQRFALFDHKGRNGFYRRRSVVDAFVDFASLNVD